MIAAVAHNFECIFRITFVTAFMAAIIITLQFSSQLQECCLVQATPRRISCFCSNINLSFTFQTKSANFHALRQVLLLEYLTPLATFVSKCQELVGKMKPVCQERFFLLKLKEKYSGEYIFSEKTKNGKVCFHFPPEIR